MESEPWTPLFPFPYNSKNNTCEKGLVTKRPNSCLCRLDRPWRVGKVISRSEPLLYPDIAAGQPGAWAWPFFHISLAGTRGPLVNRQEWWARKVLRSICPNTFLAYLGGSDQRSSESGNYMGILPGLGLRPRPCIIFIDDVPFPYLCHEISRGKQVCFTHKKKEFLKIQLEVDQMIEWDILLFGQAQVAALRMNFLVGETLLFFRTNFVAYLRRNKWNK